MVWKGEMAKQQLRSVVSYNTIMNQGTRRTVCNNSLLLHSAAVAPPKTLLFRKDVESCYTQRFAMSKATHVDFACKQRCRLSELWKGSLERQRLTSRHVTVSRNRRPHCGLLCGKRYEKLKKYVD